MDILKLLLNIEGKYNLNAFQIDGYHAWTYARFMIWQDLYHSTVGYKDARTRRGKIRSALYLAKRAFFMLFKSCHTRMRNVDICFLCHPRRILTNNAYECIYTDDLANEYPNSITLERLYKEGHLTPAKTTNLAYVDRIVLKSYLHGFTAKVIRHGKYREVENCIRAFFAKPLAELYAAAGVNFQLDRLVRHMTQRYFFYHNRRKDYRKFLNEIKPKIIVETVYYSMDAMIINELSLEMGIVSIELQHGLIGKGHAAYNYPPGLTIPQFPQKLFLFSEYWRCNAKYPIAKEHRIAIGYPYFEQQTQKLKAIPQGRQETKTIIFLSQPVLKSEFTDLAVAVSKRLSSQGWRVIFKLHPEEYINWRQLHPQLNYSKIEIIDSAKKPLYELFAASTAQVGAYSTTIFEGLGFDLQTFIYDLPGTEVMEDLIQKGYAIKISDVATLCEHLEHPENQNKVDLETIWKSNAMENMKREIDRYLKV
ncbi:hypothetical protein FACS1894204_07640 [Synergistales bacterium]|nr:hypothetical protein FACS1894204_07640 [Synergistales bacterium]